VPDITIPKLNTIDTSYTLVEWLFADGAEVPADSAVAVVETSKAATELVCAEGGFLHRMAEPPAECEAGAVIGRVFASDAERRAIPRRLTAPSPEPGPGPAGTPSEFIVTKAARELIGRHGITADDLRRLGKKVIKSADVEALALSGRRGPASEDPDGARQPAGSQPAGSQRAVAAAVSLSHRTIPAAYCVVKVEADAALAFLRERSQRSEYPIGIPELLVKSIAELHAEFGLFFASLRDDGTAVLSDAPRVGVTVDVGTGLSVPVVTDAEHLPLPDIGGKLAALRVRALRRRLSETDLAGANIALALNDDEGIVAAQPLILPPLICMLNLCSVQQEVRLRDAGRVSVGHYFHLGLAYDHRLINGREAALFLRAIKAIAEDPDRLARLARAETALWKAWTPPRSMTGWA
jgi:2-oxoglutarate dehydrogenase E2 component (dihydrolipoamide succinyltransferase)